MNDKKQLSPSQNKTNAWISVKGKGAWVQEQGILYSGKWLVFVPRHFVDQTWEKIRALTEGGQLGCGAKVRTSRPSGYSSPDHLICVYTSDYRNKDDVGRVLDKLREIGITGKLYYKSDQQTIEGVYSKEGPLTLKKQKSRIYCSDDFEK